MKTFRDNLDLLIFSWCYRVIVKLLIFSDKGIFCIDFHASERGFESPKCLESHEIHPILFFEFFTESGDIVISLI